MSNTQNETVNIIPIPTKATLVVPFYVNLKSGDNDLTEARFTMDKFSQETVDAIKDDLLKIIKEQNQS